MCDIEKLLVIQKILLDPDCKDAEMFNHWASETKLGRRFRLSYKHLRHLLRLVRNFKQHLTKYV